MPTGISSTLPSTANVESFDCEGKNSGGFTIVQRDSLESKLPLVHVNDDEETHSASKLTTTRVENVKNDLYARRRICKSNEHLFLASLQGNQINPLGRKQHAKSQNSLEDEDKRRRKDNVIENVERTSIHLSTEDFNEVLNAKLRKIQEDEESLQKCRDSKRNESIFQGRRKPFITTVKCGEFLMPPPEVGALLGIGPITNTPAVIAGGTIGGGISQNEETDNWQGPSRSRLKPLVSFGKKPEVRHSKHKARCQAAAAAAAAIKATVNFALDKTNATTLAFYSCSEQRARRNNNRKFSIRVNDGLDQTVPFGNIMYDRRVIRGSTFAAPPPALIDGEQSIAARQAEARRRHLARKRAQAQICRVIRSGSPPAIPGRKHEPVQTEFYLEELFEKPDELEVGTQTDYFLDRPPTPKYCLVKTGEDVSTQIEPGDLFDFDLEIQPIVEVIVGKTIEQALIEVLEEEEVAALREQQRRFRELRAAERAEANRLKEQERRLREEKDFCLKQHEEAVKIQQETEDRVAAAVLLTGYIAELLPAVLEGLKMSGFLLDEIKADVEEGFMPWLMKEVKKEMGNMIESRELLMVIIKEILENRVETYRRLGEEEYGPSGRRISADNHLEDGGQDKHFLNYDELSFLKK
ncbi:PREDICTED: radial spoke head protein 3 homolog B isoform X2 [Polistes canadensis]|uniref:radial spoke head protein 3 homolog B isoform X2 n=1 Tax=Polistes canadensis TaxID=91411 RepID=UPI000718CC8F|nr:PREDICTED: radial spoke head protein 3 homolog B isoform X2 [Polistes canadensis]